jgi:hypothetical protein
MLQAPLKFHLGFLLAFAGVLCCAPAFAATIITLWDFNSNPM